MGPGLGSFNMSGLPQALQSRSLGAPPMADGFGRAIMGPTDAAAKGLGQVQGQSFCSSICSPRPVELVAHSPCHISVRVLTLAPCPLLHPHV